MSTESQRTPTPTESAQPELDHALQAVIKKYIGSALKTAKQSSSKRAHSQEDDEGPPSDDKGYASCGRIYGRQDDPFTSINKVVNFGIKYEVADEEEDEEEQRKPISESKESDERLLHSWKLLCSIIPDFCRQMLALSDHLKLRKAACQQIYGGVATVRANDTSSLKTWIPSYILLNSNDSLTPPIAMRNKLKNDRGFYHPITASLLCPVSYPDNLETYAYIKAGRLPITAELLPRFLFPHNHIHDPANISKDLLCGHVMYRAAKHIFQGPSSALEEPGAHRGKQGNAAICGITTMSPRTIAYVAAQVRFALSSATSWAPKDGMFSYIDFYWHIVGFLDDEDDVESQDIIKFYNYQVFGAKDPRCNTTPEVPEVEDEYALMKKQRAAKRARPS